VVRVAGRAPERLEHYFARFSRLGIRSAKINLLEQVMGLRLGAGEVVPHVLPAEAVQLPVEFFRGQALFPADAPDVVVGLEAVPTAAQELAPSRRRGRYGLVRAERHAPLANVVIGTVGVVVVAIIIAVVAVGLKCWL
jgi:hypothetical protein